MKFVPCWNYAIYILLFSITKDVGLQDWCANTHYQNTTVIFADMTG